MVLRNGGENVAKSNAERQAEWRAKRAEELEQAKAAAHAATTLAKTMAVEISDPDGAKRIAELEQAIAELTDRLIRTEAMPIRAVKPASKRKAKELRANWNGGGWGPVADYTDNFFGGISYALWMLDGSNLADMGDPSYMDRAMDLILERHTPVDTVLIAGASFAARAYREKHGIDGDRSRKVT